MSPVNVHNTCVQNVVQAANAQQNKKECSSLIQNIKLLRQSFEEI